VVENGKGRSSPGKAHWRGALVLDLHDEVLSVVFGGNGVLDDVQGIATSSKT
jgi:hypothetical protein